MRVRLVSLPSASGMTPGEPGTNSGWKVVKAARARGPQRGEIGDEDERENQATSVAARLTQREGRHCLPSSATRTAAASGRASSRIRRIGRFASKTVRIRRAASVRSGQQSCHHETHE